MTDDTLAAADLGRAVDLPSPRRRSAAPHRRKAVLEWIALHSLAVAAALFFVLPFVFVFLTAMMSDQQALTRNLWPTTWEWHNIATVWNTPGFLTWWRNTLFYAGLGTVLTLLSSIPVAYALARFRFKGRNLAMMVVISTMMLPPQVVIVPMYLFWAKQLHLSGTLWPLIIPLAFGDPFSIFLLRQFLLTIPKEYIDAAKVDGCGDLRALLAGGHPDDQAGDRRRRLVRVLQLLERLLRAADLRQREPGRLDAQLRARVLQERPPHELEPDDGRDVAGHGAGDRRVLLRAEGVHRRRDAHRGEGMKIAVVGGGSTYTPELVDGLARLRDSLPVDELVLVDPDADRLDLVGGLGRRILAKQGHQARLTTTHDLDVGRGRRRSRAASSSASAARPRARRTRPGHSSAAASARRPRARAASRRRCGPCRSSSTSPSGYGERAPTRGSSTSRTRSGSSPGRCSRRGTRRSGCAMSRSASSAGSPPCCRSSPDAVELGHVGLNHLTWERSVTVGGVDRLPELIADHAAEIADDIGLPASLLGALWARFRRTTCVTSTRTTRWSGSCWPSRHVPPRWRRSSATSSSCTPTRALDEKPALLAQPWRRLLLGGGDRSERGPAGTVDTGQPPTVQVVNTRNGGTLPFLPADAVIEVPARVDESGASPLPVAPLSRCTPAWSRP